MKRLRLIKGLGLALLATVVFVPGNPAMAWTSPRVDVRSSDVSASQDKWPPRSNQSPAGAWPRKSQPHQQPDESGRTDSRNTNPWARKPPLAINFSGEGRRPWGKLPPHAESKNKPKNDATVFSSRPQVSQPVYPENRYPGNGYPSNGYPGTGYPVTAYPPNYGAPYVGQYPGYGGNDYPNSFGPWGNNNSFGNGFPMNNFPFSFW